MVLQEDKHAGRGWSHTRRAAEPHSPREAVCGVYSLFFFSIINVLLLNVPLFHEIISIEIQNFDH